MTVHGCNYVGHCLATFIGKHNLIYTCIVPANDVVVVVMWVECLLAPVHIEEGVRVYSLARSKLRKNR